MAARSSRVDYCALAFRESEHEKASGGVGNLSQLSAMGFGRLDSHAGILGSSVPCSSRMLTDAARSVSVGLSRFFWKISLLLGE